METGLHTPQLDPYAQSLYDAVEAAVPGWVTRRIHAVLQMSSSGDTASVHGQLEKIAEETKQFVTTELFQLLIADVDAQRTNPLHILRRSSLIATRALQQANISPVHRDEFDKSALPDDVYAIGPHTWRDLSEEVHEAGITWGAWKAATVIQRRRSEGKQ